MQLICYCCADTGGRICRRCHRNQSKSKEKYDPWLRRCRWYTLNCEYLRELLKNRNGANRKIRGPDERWFMKKPVVKNLLTLSFSTVQNFAHEIYHIFLWEKRRQNLKLLLLFRFSKKFIKWLSKIFPFCLSLKNSILTDKKREGAICSLYYNFLFQ